ncbi:hypothetical protein KDL45_07110 [bacterium]|nr:hypothetical protein [bacterium]
MSRPLRRFATAALFVACMSLLAGCGSFVSNFAQDLTNATLKHPDPATIQDALPTFLLILEARLESDPNDEALLLATAKMYTGYNLWFVAGNDQRRAKILADRAKDYAVRGFSQDHDEFAALHDKPYQEFDKLRGTFDEDDVADLDTVVGAWASWVITHADQSDAIADLAKLRLLSEELLRLNPEYNYGSPHLYLGMILTVVPPGMNAEFEKGREHFEEAVRLSDGVSFPAYVAYAQRYAKTVFDRELHDQLLQYVVRMRTDVVPELTLINTLAQRQAEQLLAEADDYF